LRSFASAWKSRNPSAPEIAVTLICFPSIRFWTSISPALRSINDAGDVIEIAPENDPRSRPEATAFANRYAALLAEHAIQNNDQSLRHRDVGLSIWVAFAFVAGATVASLFIYFLAH
jgi:hypothetical protein